MNDDSVYYFPYYTNGIIKDVLEIPLLFFKSEFKCSSRA
jgi:hypothetical protein